MRLIPLLVLTFAVGCATTPPICQPGAARQTGYYEAVESKPLETARGEVCSAQETWAEDYRVGYQEGLRKLCDVAAVERQGATTGSEGRAAAFNPTPLRFCENTDELKQAYEASYRRSLASLCDQDVTELSAQAFHEGTEGEPRRALKEKLALCEPARRRALETAYRESYEKGLGEWCGSDSVSREAARRAHLGSSPEFPQKLVPCLERFPEIAVHYPALFSAERKRFVQSHCTYQAGLSDGQTEAGQTNLRKQTSPSHCDSADEDRGYFEGYLEGWKQRKDRLCDVAAAYDRGAEDARRGKPREFSVPALCPRDYEVKLYDQYLQGYRFIVNQSAGR